MIVLRICEGKRKSDRTRYETSREVGIQNFLIEFEEKQLKWCGCVKRMDIMWILRRVLVQ
jgi:hypothetical protein